MTGFVVQGHIWFWNWVWKACATWEWNITLASFSHKLVLFPDGASEIWTQTHLQLTLTPPEREKSFCFSLLWFI